MNTKENITIFNTIEVWRVIEQETDNKSANL